MTSVFNIEGGVIQFRGGLSSDLAAANPLVHRRELLVEIDTGLYKVGNGSTNWLDLPYGGLIGPQGISAYQVALTAGFVGTQAQWLASLVGPIGDVTPAATEALNQALQAVQDAIAQVQIATAQANTAAGAASTASLKAAAADTSSQAAAAQVALANAAQQSAATQAGAAAQSASIAGANATTATQQAAIGAAAQFIRASSAAGVTGATAVASGAYYYVASTNTNGAFDVWLNSAGTAVATGITLPNLAAVTALQAIVTALQASLLSGEFDASYIPLVVDDSGNVPVWVENGTLAAAALSPALLAAIASNLSSNLLASTDASWPEFIIYTADGSVMMVVDTDGVKFFGVNQATISPAVVALPIATPGRTLSNYRAVVANVQAAVAGSVAKVIFTGDSWSEHLMETAQPLANALYAAYGQSGNGWVSVHADEKGPAANSGSQLLNGAVLYKSTGWTLYQLDPVISLSLDGFAITSSSTTDTVNIASLKTQTLTWYYLDGPGVFRYSVDGGAPTVVTCGNTGTVKSIVISGLTDATHAFLFDLVGNAGLVTFYGGYAQRTAVGIEFSKAGKGGAQATDWAACVANTSKYIASIAPQVVIIMLGTNDCRAGATQTTFKTALQTMVSSYTAAAPLASIIIVAVDRNGSVVTTQIEATIPLYRDAGYAIQQATPGAEFLNGCDAFPATFALANAAGLWQSDAVHHTLAGGYYYTDLLMKHFLKVN